MEEEVVHHLVEGKHPVYPQKHPLNLQCFQLGWLKPQQNDGMFTIYQLVQAFAGPSTVWLEHNGWFLKSWIPSCHHAPISHGH